MLFWCQIRIDGSRALFRSLAGYKIDNPDNGTVRNHKPY